FAPHRDRVAMDGARPDARVLDLGEERLPEIRVRTVLVVGQTREKRLDLTDPLPTFLADETTFRERRERPMGHGHVTMTSSSTARRRRAARSAIGCVRRHA